MTPAPPVPVLVSEDRVLRTVTGLRPFRPEGFRVEAERLGDILLIHDYGHGGAGWTLAWGTARMATELALAQAHRRAAVIGAGIVGLTAARDLQRAGFTVEIHAEAFPPDTTSDVAGAQWTPTCWFDEDALTPAAITRMDRALRLSLAAYTAHLGDERGVRRVTNWLVDAREIADDDAFRARWPGLLPEPVDLGPGEHPFPVDRVRCFETLFMEPPVYLPRLVDDVRRDGGTLHRRRFESLDDVRALGAPVVVNCTGLGARGLVGDASMTPVKGQITILAPQPGVDYLLLDGERYMFPRRDGILLGGTMAAGDWSLAPDETARARLLAGHAERFRAMSRLVPSG